MLPGRRIERLVHKLSVENQVFTQRAAARWLLNKGELDGYTNKGKLRSRLGLGRAAGKQLPAGSNNHLPAAAPPRAVKGLCPWKTPPIRYDLLH